MELRTLITLAGIIAIIYVATTLSTKVDNLYGTLNDPEFYTNGVHHE